MLYVYLLASKPHGTLYIGTISDLARRIWEHKNRLVAGFTKRYEVDRPVWFEVHEFTAVALRREKQIKEWKRDWKINLLERDNPHWTDLYATLTLWSAEPQRSLPSRRRPGPISPGGTGLRRCRRYTDACE